MVKPDRLLVISRKFGAAHILLIISVFLSTIFLYKKGGLEFLELSAYDQLLRLRSPTADIPHSAVINITEHDIRQLSRWPVSDATLADILVRLIGFQPRAVGVDIYRDLPVPPGHEELHAVLRQNPIIIGAMKFGAEGSSGVPPPPSLANTNRFGFTDVFPDRDGIVRRGLLFLDDGKISAYSFALRLALRYLQKEGITPAPDTENPGYIQLGATTIKPFEANDGGYINADARGYQFPLDFCEPSTRIPRYTLAQLRSGQVPISDIKNRVVLIGVSAESVKDFFLTPCSRGSLSTPRISGAHLHAAIADQLIRTALKGDVPLKTASELEEILWILFWCIAGALIGGWLGSHYRFALIQIAGLGALSSISTLLFFNGTWLITATPAIAWLSSSILSTAYKASQEKRERALLMNLFSRHVAAEIAEEIWQKRDEFFADGRPLSQKTTATIMFTDLREFTTLAEKLEPSVLFEWLNDYVAGMTPLIAANGGVVIRFIGDAIMAGFGIPVPSKSEFEIRQDAINAVRCAVSMEEKLIELNRQWRDKGLPVVGMRIGLCTGPLVTGSLGDRKRMEYTVHGDTVNTAARLESFDKSNFVPDLDHRPCRILIGDATLNYVDGQFQTEAIGQAKLRGKEGPVGVFCVLGHAHHAPRSD